MGRSRPEGAEPSEGTQALEHCLAGLTTEHVFRIVRASWPNNA